MALFFWSSFLSLCALGLGLWFWQAMEALLAQNIWLGRVALALAGVAAAALSFASLREFASLSRIRRIDALRERFPHIAAPKKDDICYATQNRQDAVKQLCESVELLLVVGAPNSSNSNRLQEFGIRAGVESHLITRADDIAPEWLTG